MMEQRKITYPILNHVVGIKKLIFATCIVIGCFSMTYAQNICDSYDQDLDDTVMRMFTSSRSEIVTSREMAFPSAVHNINASQVRRLNFPEEQWICDTILNKIYKNEPTKGPPTYHALYKVNDHYFMVIYKYYTASDGSQLIEEPTVGGLYGPQFNRVGLIAM